MRRSNDGVLLLIFDVPTETFFEFGDRMMGDGSFVMFFCHGILVVDVSGGGNDANLVSHASAVADCLTLLS